MKNDNTEDKALNKTDVKCRFFAQYYELEVAKHSTKNYFVKHILDKVGENYFLELKPLSKITDEDAILMYRGLERNYESSNQFLEDYKSIGFLEQSEVDYLRSKGYAVPFMEYSVDDLISFGWVRLV